MSQLEEPKTEEEESEEEYEEEEKTLTEERVTSFPFNSSNQNDCDVLIITEDKDLLFRSAFLNLISDAFQKSWAITENSKDGRKVIEMKDTKADVVVEALSFYFPKFYDTLKGIYLMCIMLSLIHI